MLLVGFLSELGEDALKEHRKQNRTRSQRRATVLTRAQFAVQESFAKETFQQSGKAETDLISFFRIRKRYFREKPKNYIAKIIRSIYICKALGQNRMFFTKNRKGVVEDRVAALQPQRLSRASTCERARLTRVFSKAIHRPWLIAESEVG